MKWRRIRRQSRRRVPAPGAADFVTDTAENLPEIESPCIGVCSLTEDDVCIGCYRTVTEVIGWLNYTPEQRREIIESLPERGQRYFDGG